ncbi:MAG: 5,6-dimethylbenzimidazole synthase [Roseibium sp.]|uniref:5,6-dimethylbenzimidazole synthase n=1 Tax=Roseibium sp. TaxID=1936156 RepID=UPI001B1FD403|nr:5,6-dimethylbenzimidazole synthase [Roseibium sp.]MBO6894147.1 5,6-dimethylbenzimidazole synthase [Roseibium sp.]MBO6930695.1 5,6-dimethylbenzimidazole synthase [Roseibium sp.]
MSPPEFTETFRQDFQTLLEWRRDVRRFRRDPVPPETLDRLLHLADLAPSVGNSQPWRLVLVESAEARAKIVEIFEAENEAAARTYTDEQAGRYRQLKLSGLKEAPVHLAVFSDENPQQGHGLGRATMHETLAYSTVSMIHTFWLAARSEDIGVGWVSILDPERVTEILQVDDGWRLVAYLCVGFPEEDNIVPELERTGWQSRSPLETRLFRR